MQKIFLNKIGPLCCSCKARVLQLRPLLRAAFKLRVKAPVLLWCSFTAHFLWPLGTVLGKSRIDCAAGVAAETAAVVSRCLFSCCRMAIQC